MPEAISTGPGRTNGRSRRSQPRPSPEILLQLHVIQACDSVLAVGALLAVFIATNLGRMPEGFRDFLALRITVKNLLYLIAFALAWRLLCRVTGLYDWQRVKRRSWEAVRVTVTCALVSTVALAFPTMSVSGAFRYSTVFYFWICASLGMLVLRIVVRTLVSAPEAGSRREAIIVGTGPRALRLLTELQHTRPDEYNIVGFLDSDDQRPPATVNGSFLGTLDDIEVVLMRHAIDEVFIALPIKSRYAEIQQVIESCERVGVRARYLADLFGPSRGWVSQVENEQVSLVAAPPAPKGWRFAAKRAIDLVGASAALILLAPVLLLAGLAIKLTSPGPILFTQDRYGMNRRLFRMYKLRTMTADAEQLQSGLEALNEASGPVFKIREDPRITPVGRWLRRSSIDELPQLFNVLRGEMSLVGPRPLPVRDVHRFTQAALMRRFSVRPGLTCLWQVSGRSDVGFQEWVRLDLKYIDEWSIPLDLEILLKTLPAVLKGTGAT